MSAEPSVQVGKEIPEALVILAAVLVALGTGFFWWRAVSKRSAG
jgi:hypothetical protein